MTSDDRSALGGERLVLTKHHGLGNDFLIALVGLGKEPQDLPGLAVELCHRHHGVGADGLIVGAVSGDSIRFVLHNADGSRAETSGNGLRCFGQALLLRSGEATLDQMIDTDVGPRRLLVKRTKDPMVVLAQVEMGLALPGPQVTNVPVPTDLGALRIDSVDMGNPHIVLQVEDPMRWDMATVGPAIEQHFMPTGTNVHLVSPGRSRKELIMNIWERGAGVTEACGSGACAAAVVGRRWGLCEARVDVMMPGGSAHVEVGENVKLTGPASYVATIDIPR